MSLKVSELLDGQLESAELQPVLKNVASDPGSRDRFTIYGLIGDSLRGNSTPDDGYSLRILQRMREQAARIEPGFDPFAD
jgi:negative regulator of sigma E activity